MYACLCDGIIGIKAGVYCKAWENQSWILVKYIGGIRGLDSGPLDTQSSTLPMSHCVLILIALIGSLVLECLIRTEGLRVRASLASLRCGH